MLLAFDTSMAACSAAVYDLARDRLVAGRFALMERGHADALAPMIREVMAEAGVDFADLKRIGVTRGPGTFTGVRTGIAMARGLALALEVKIAAIDTLSAIAANAPDAAPLIIAADARRDEVYFLSGPDAAPVVLPVAEAVHRLPPERAFVLGTGAEALIAMAPPDRLLRLTAGDMPDARNFARACAAHPPASTPTEPLYLRPPDARPQHQGVTSPSALTIRAAMVGEAPVLSALHTECFDNAWSATELAKLMAMPGAVTYLAIEGDEPVAFLLARQAAGEAEILTIGTRPFARRRGIAKKLMSHLADDLRAAGSSRLFIEVAAGNEAARALYQAEDFTVTGARKAYYERPGGRREDAVVMMKTIS